jgi:hypothetical protein
MGKASSEIFLQLMKTAVDSRQEQADREQDPSVQSVALELLKAIKANQR